MKRVFHAWMARTVFSVLGIESAETSFIRKIFYLVHRQTNLIVKIKHLSFQERAQAEKAYGNY